MRIVTIMLILSFVPYFGHSQNTISGKIVDELGLPVYLATVEINDTEDIAYTDFEGFFSLKSEKGFHWKIEIKSKGYKTESFFVLSGGSTGDIILEYNAEMRKLLEGQ
ncbi:carboxypeptidase-like regulatory domain-containing protein [uncultured Allomuricauda sp.]|uniref:carboxypeptidase-like regulatory domain-containing protein n=1 Tax=Flagellimonas sp. W118 TaxID=3410791 RepID=UPI00261FEC3C|nr:carboxypeptidase-like regulatory domain-containing protein [uncultured Allomuricauda sp.]